MSDNLNKIFTDMNTLTNKTMMTNEEITMKNIIEEIENEIPLVYSYEEDARYNWPKRWKELKQRLEAGQQETVVMWRSVEDEIPLVYSYEEDARYNWPKRWKELKQRLEAGQHETVVI